MAHELADLVFAELRTFFNSFLQGDSGVPSGSRDIDAGTPNQAVGSGHPAQNGMRSTVLTNNNGVILGSIANDAASSASRRHDSLNKTAGANDTASASEAFRRRRQALVHHQDRFCRVHSGKGRSPRQCRCRAISRRPNRRKVGAHSKCQRVGESQLDAAGKQLREAEAAIEQFRAQHNAIIEVAPGNSVAVNQQLAQLLSNLNIQLAGAAQARIAAERNSPPPRPDETS